MFRESVSVMTLLKSIPASEGVNSRKRTGSSLQAKRHVINKHSPTDLLPRRQHNKGEILNEYPISMNFFIGCLRITPFENSQTILILRRYVQCLFIPGH